MQSLIAYQTDPMNSRASFYALSLIQSILRQYRLWSHEHSIVAKGDTDRPWEERRGERPGKSAWSVSSWISASHQSHLKKK